MPFCEKCPLWALQRQTLALPETEQRVFNTLAGRALSLANPDGSQFVGAWDGNEPPSDVTEEAWAEFSGKEFSGAWLGISVGAMTGQQIVGAAVECSIRNDVE